MGLKQKWIVIGIVLALFGLRLFYGLSSEFWFDDEKQIYAIGLKFYSTGNFPYFGPDVVYTESQIPGSLQGLLVGIPFYIFPAPESPYILLNLLSIASLIVFALYLQKKFSRIPFWFTWSWIFICPWAMHFSTHIINPSYVLFGSILFFIAFFETLPMFSIHFFKKNLAFFIMGFCLFWVYQFHLSWVLLLPFLLYSLWINVRKQPKVIFYCISGSLVTLSFLLPTFIKYGLHAGSGDVASNIVLNTANFKEIANLVMRFFSFASYELWRFIDMGEQSRFVFFSKYWWSSPFVVLVIIVGVFQTAYLFLSLFFKSDSKEFLRVKIIIIFILIITYLSFLFSVKSPSSHTFYILFPLVMIYSFYCWERLFRKRWFVLLMIAMLVSGIITQSTIAVNNLGRKSMYLNRSLPLKAITEKDYLIFTSRRAFDRNN